MWHQGGPRKAHHISWELSYGPILAGLEILHTCDTPLCVRPDHLQIGTHEANMADASRKGRLRVSRPKRQKVTPDDIAEIRRRVAAGERHRVVAADFGIARNTVSELIKGKRRQYDAPLRPSLEQAS
jgi:hypothetical protein